MLNDDERPLTITVFYSDYSGNCKALLQILNNPSNGLRHLGNLRYVNVDSREMRNKILKKFFQVPAIAVVYSKTMSLYLGGNAFDWVERFEQQSGVPEENPTPPASSVADGAKPPTAEPAAKKKTIVELAAEIEEGRKLNV